MYTYMHVCPLDEATSEGPPYVYTYKKIMYWTLKILESMSEFGGLWKRQNTQACSEKCPVFKMLVFDSI